MAAKLTFVNLMGTGISRTSAIRKARTTQNPPLLPPSCFISIRRTAAGLVFTIFLFAVIARAQSAAANGSISGTVTDPQGKAVPLAKITIRNNDFASSRVLKTDEAGKFIASFLPAGTYTVEAEAHGFKTKRTARLTLDVGSSLRISLQLDLAGLSQKVTVSGRRDTQEGNTLPPAVNKEEAEVSNTIAGLPVTYLPSRVRDFTALGLLSTGVQLDRRADGLVVAGQRSNASKTAIDGADFDDPLQGGPRGAKDGGLFFPQTVVREFQIVHAGASAEVGGTNAGFVNVATKEGSNKLHGELFYIGRPSLLTSSDAFGRGLDNDQNEFGGSIGGPIKKNRAFFYVGGEQDFLHVPYWTAFQTQAPGVIVPASLIALQNQNVERNNPTALFGRGDVLLDSKNTLNLQINYNRIRASDFSAGSTRSIASSDNNISLSGQSVWGRGSLTTLFGSNLVNQFLGQLASDRRDFMPSSASPEMVINGFGVLGGNSLSPHRYTSNRRELSDDLSIQLHGSVLHFGVDFANNPARERHEANLNGRFDFNSLADFVAGTPRRYQQTFVTGDTEYSGTVRQLGFYINDNLPITTKLTLTAGLRWEGQWNPEPNHPNPAVPQTARVPDDLKQWQPRLGLAWNPVSSTVLRFSTGIYDAPTPATIFQRVFTDNGSQTIVADSYFDPQLLPLVTTPGMPPHALSAPPAGLTTPAALVVGIAPDFRNPRSFQAAGSIERQLNAKLDVSAGYLRNSTWGLQRRVDRNLAAPAIDANGMPIFPAARPNPAFGRLLINESSAHSSYDGLLLNASLQLPHRSQLTANYTLSRTRDDDSNLGPFGLDSALNPFNLAAERAYSSLDMRHNFNVNAIFNLPLGFKFNPIFLAHSGLPYTPVIGLDTQRDANDLNDRAILNGVVAERNSERQPAFFDLDVRLVKDITLPGEGHHLDLFMDIFNVTAAENRNFGPEAISLFGTPTAPVFTAGQPLFAPDTSRFGSARQVQFTIRLVGF